MINEEQYIRQIEEVIIAFATGDFSKRIEKSNNKSVRDSIIAGVNMLGEELEQTTISRDYFSNIYNAVSDILIVTDKEGFVTDVNEAIQKRTGASKDKFLGKNFHCFIPDGKLDLKEVNGSINFETKFIDAIGNDFPINCSISSIINRYDEHDGYLIIAKDTTEKKLQEEQVLKVMVSTQEKERERFAYDMHDSLGQELNAINLSLSTMNHIGKDNEQYDEIFQKCRYMVSHSIGTMKKIAFDLMPKSLEDGNLNLALRELVFSLEDLCVIHSHFEEKITFLEGVVNVVVYRVFQEFISNSMKHSKSSTINLLMKKKDGKLVFILSDDGIGFNKTTVKQGNGLRNIESRLEAIKAPYSFTSKENKGTILKFEIQL